MLKEFNFNQTCWFIHRFCLVDHVRGWWWCRDLVCWTIRVISLSCERQAALKRAQRHTDSNMREHNTSSAQTRHECSKCQILCLANHVSWTVLAEVGLIPPLSRDLARAAWGDTAQAGHDHSSQHTQEKGAPLSDNFDLPVITKEVLGMESWNLAYLTPD